VHFLFPVFLLGGLAIAVPIVLHFLRRDVAPPVPFTAVRLLRKSPVARSKRRRLRDLLLLAARVVALLLLAAAFARPYVAGAARGSTLRIIAVDRSYSMNAPGRFAHALDLAGRAIDEAAVGERVAVLAFDDHVGTVAAPGSATAARTALAAISAGFGATRYSEVFSKAAEIAAGDEARLILVSDLQRSGWDGEDRSVLPAGISLDVRDAGRAPSNLSVVSVSVTPDRVIAAVRNSGPQPRSGKIRIEHDGRIAQTSTYTVGPDSSVDVAIPYRPPATGTMTVSIDDPDGLSADNSRFVVLDAVPSNSVLLVTSGANSSGYYITRALAALGGTDVGRIDVRSSTAAALADDNLTKYSAVVLLSTRALDRRGRESIAGFVRAGGGLLIAGSPEVEAAVVSAIFNWSSSMTGTIEMPAAVALSPTDPRHPVFRPFASLSANLGQVRFARAWRMTPDGWDMAARFTDGNPALVERREGSGRVVLFASDLDRQWNDFPLHPAFVPFVIEAIRYLSAPHDRGRDYIVGTAPPGADLRPGAYRVGPDNRLIAVNVDPREGVTKEMGQQEFAQRVERVDTTSGSSGDVRSIHLEARQSYWRYGLLLMLLALVAESFVGRA
jgi:aerotolerance regulator-like protein/VWA domain-containing protein